MKTPTHKFSVNIPIDLLDTIKMRADDHQRSVNGEIIYMLRKHLDHVAEGDAMAAERVRQSQGK